ncbi:hypothetical protein [Nonomuraea sp. NPDC050643]|uniref:hypothetical protein n=1 Tax=Nonomuraea sp. NPDC050643 TaxID=3155660 RepID=UPI00340A9595
MTPDGPPPTPQQVAAVRARLTRGRRPSLGGWKVMALAAAAASASRQTTKATTLAGPVVAAAKPISGCVDRAWVTVASAAGAMVSHSMASVVWSNSSGSISTSK